MKDRRIGIDINVEWSILGDGVPYILDGKDVTLILCTPYGKHQVANFTISGNQVRWTFAGKDQHSTGKYSLELIVNKDKLGQVITDACNFVNLVSCSCKVGGADEANVTTESIELTSELGFLPYDDAELREAIATLETEKVDKEEGKGLSTNDYTDEEKEKNVVASFLNGKSLQGLPFGYVGGTYQSYQFDGQVNDEIDLGVIKEAYYGNIAFSYEDKLYEFKIQDLKGEGATLGTILVRVTDDNHLIVKPFAPRVALLGWRTYGDKTKMPSTWVEGGGSGGGSYDDTGIKKDISDLKENDALQDAELAKLSAEVGKKVDADKVATINGQSLVQGGNITIVGGEKGEKGDKGDKGDQGNSGYTGAADELEVVNNLTQGGATAALSAEMGKVLSAEIEVIEEQVNAPKVTWEKTTEDADIEWLDNTRLAWNNTTESVAGYKTSAKIILLDSKTKYVLFPYISKKPYSYYGAIFFDTGFNVVNSMKVPQSANQEGHNIIVEIPENIKAMRVSKSDADNFSFTEYQTMNELANALADLTSLEEVQAETKVGSVLYANKQYTQTEGILESTTTARYKRIKVLEGETYTIVGSADANMAVWRWNDKHSKTILSNVDIASGEMYGTKKAFVEITAPKNAVWLYVGWVVSGNKAIDEGHIYRKKTGAMDALRNIRTSEYPQFDFSSYYQDGKSDNFYDYVTPLENDAYIVVGQSNVDGRINNAQFPATITFGGKTIETSKSLTNLQFMKSSVNSVYDELTKKFQPRNNTGAWAFDEIIYNLLDKLVYNPSSNNRDFYVLKATKGATTIEPRYSEAFSADIKVLKDKGWNSMMIHLKNLIKSAKLQNPNLRFKGIIIYECEGDMTVTKYPYQYYNNLGGMIAYIRGLVGQPNIPVFIGAPATNLPDYNQLVVDDMRELAKNMNDIHLIEIGESEGWVDDGMNVHFNAAAATRIGGLYYQAMVDAKII